MTKGWQPEDSNAFDEHFSHYGALVQIFSVISMDRSKGLGMATALFGLAIAGSILSVQETMPSALAQGQPTIEHQSSTPLTPQAMEQFLYQAINDLRFERNLGRLQLHAVLGNEALRYSQDLAIGSNAPQKFPYDRIQAQLPLKKAKVIVDSVQSSNAPTGAMLTRWLEQNGANELWDADFDLIGLGIVTNDQQQYFITQVLATPVAAQDHLRSLEMEAHNLVNAHRRSQNLPGLVLDERISAVARAHSEAMARGEAAFSHAGFDQRAEIIKQTIPFQSLGENLSKNMGYANTAQVTVDGWIDSPTHHENMVGGFNLTGMGVAQGDRGEYYFTQLFLMER